MLGAEPVREEGLTMDQFRFQGTDVPKMPPFVREVTFHGGGAALTYGGHTICGGVPEGAPRFFEE